MTPTDPRHGSYAGTAAHYADNETPCDPCRDAGFRVRKRNAYLAVVGRPATVPATGTVRRLQALRAIGWSLPSIARESGLSEHTLRKPLVRSKTVYRATADRVAETYDRLSMTLPQGGYADRSRAYARRQGWAPPLAWDDIDNDPAPIRTRTSHADVDPVVVRRILDRDPGPARDATNTERHEITHRWLELGRPLKQLGDLTGWKVERYTTQTPAAVPPAAAAQSPAAGTEGEAARRPGTTPHQQEGEAA